MNGRTTLALLTGALAMVLWIGVADARTPSKGCVCPMVYTPVCGVDGKTYTNSCVARCRGVKARCRGKCPCVKCPGGQIACTFGPKKGKCYPVRCRPGYRLIRMRCPCCNVCRPIRRR